MKIVTSITIAAPRKGVWRTFLAVERWPEWSPWGLHFPEQPRLELGAAFFVTLPAPFFPLVTLRFPCRVTALEDSSVICWTGKVIGVPGYHRFTFKELPEGCRVLSEEEFHGPLTLLIRPVRGIIEARVVEFLARLRGAAAAIVE